MCEIASFDTWRIWFILFSPLQFSKWDRLHRNGSHSWPKFDGESKYDLSDQEICPCLR
jgi:hypothetical protein